MFLFHRTKKPVIVTIHGFGKKLHTEFDPLATYLKQKQYTVIQFDIYDINDPNDADYKQWIDRCEQKMLEITKKYDHIVLLGFSMGGVIASYLASIFSVDQLILVAPAFEYITAHTVIKAVKNMYTNSPEKDEKPSSKQTSAFTEIINHYKESIRSVDCPVLLLHGLKDEVIPLSSSRNAYTKIHSKHRLICFEEGKHRMLYDNTIQETIFPIIELMLTNQLM